MLQLLGTADLSGIAPFIAPIQCYQERRKKATQQRLGSCCSTPAATQKAEAIGFWHQLLVAGSVVLAFFFFGSTLLRCGYCGSGFPAHWAPVVLQQLQQKEDRYRVENPSWMDQEEAPADIRKQWQEARANRRMQFKVGNYRDGSWESNIRMLTGTIKADWIQLPVERYTLLPFLH